MRCYTVWLACICTVCGLKILLTTPESWVCKDVRFLHANLRKHGHEVTTVASLYYKQESPRVDLLDGGDFGHLLPIHQRYFEKLRYINYAHERGHRGSRRSLTGQPQQYVDPVMDHDPLDKSVYFVNNHALAAIPRGLAMLQDVDLIVVIGDKDDGMLEQMAADGVRNDLPTIAVKLTQPHHVYYQDENHFKVQHPGDRNLRNNQIGGIIRHNNRVVQEFIASSQLTGSPKVYDIELPYFGQLGFHKLDATATKNNLRLPSACQQVLQR